MCPAGNLPKILRTDGLRMTMIYRSDVGATWVMLPCCQGRPPGMVELQEGLVLTIAGNEPVRPPRPGIYDAPPHSTQASQALSDVVAMTTTLLNYLGGKRNVSCLKHCESGSLNVDDLDVCEPTIAFKKFLINRVGSWRHLHSSFSSSFRNRSFLLLRSREAEAAEVWLGQLAVWERRRVASPSSVSSSFLEKANSGEDESLPPSSEGDRLINGYAIFLLQGVVSHELRVTVGLLLTWMSTPLTSGPARNFCDGRIAPILPGTSKMLGYSIWDQEDFFFVYTYMFDQMYIHVPFTEFQASVLKELNIAPSQLHLNGWAVVQAFTLLCATDPHKIKAFSIGRLNAVERDAVSTINNLSLRLNACSFVDCFKYEDFDLIAFRYMTLPKPRKTRSSSSKGLDRSSAASSHAPITKVQADVPPVEQVTVVIRPEDVVTMTQTTRVVQPDPIPVTVLDQSSGTTTESKVLLERKRKSKEGGSKQSRHEGKTPLVHLPAGVDFHASSSQRAVIEPLSEGELLSATVELHGTPEILTKVGKAEEQEASTALRRRLEALALDHEGCGEKHGQLTEAKESLKAAQSRCDKLAEEVKKLRLEVRCLDKRGDELAEQSQRFSTDLLDANMEKGRLTNELIKANEMLTTLDSHMVIKHEEGFNKAMCQAAFLLNLEPLAVGFDIHQDVFGGEIANDAEDGGERVDVEPEPVGDEEERGPGLVGVYAIDLSNICFIYGRPLLVVVIAVHHPAELMEQIHLLTRLLRTGGGRALSFTALPGHSRLPPCRVDGTDPLINVGITVHHPEKFDWAAFPSWSWHLLLLMTLFEMS
ncbi:hypothetical protein V8G54_034178 [Vigna mungo]|uniref:Uncharacterized protein n=1 Tax=Vigna mungo TaxID=3915 RepID=A0AAQ3MQ80_VIGMU